MNTIIINKLYLEFYLQAIEFRYNIWVAFYTKRPHISELSWGNYLAQKVSPLGIRNQTQLYVNGLLTFHLSLTIFELSK